MSNSRQYFFVHVMKTAGGTFKRHIGRNFGRHECYPPQVTEAERNDIYMSTDHLQSLSPEQRREYRVISGHYPFAARHLLDDDVTTLTLLRDPVERAISHVRLIQRADPRFSDNTLSEVYNDPMSQSFFFRNYQARVFAYDDPTNPTAMAEVDWTPERIETAQANLASIDIVGLREHLDAFLDEVQATLGWEIHAGVRSKNVAADADIDPALRAQIAADNEIDIRFYEWAVDHIEGRRR